MWWRGEFLGGVTSEFMHVDPVAIFVTSGSGPVRADWGIASAVNQGSFHLGGGYHLIDLSDVFKIPTEWYIVKPGPV
jgi:hypothetical protein